VEGFTIVTRKKGQGRRGKGGGKIEDAKRVARLMEMTDQEEEEEGEEKTREREERVKSFVTSFANDLQSSSFFESFSQTLGDHVRSLLGESSPSRAQIVCYGLGKITQNKKSQLQLSLLLLLQTSIRNQEPIQGIWSSCSWPIVAFDPVFSPSDRRVLEGFGVHVLDQNDKCRWNVEDCPITIFFMPHAERFMFVNVLETNSDNLDRLIVIGNDLTQYEERAILRSDRAAIQPLVHLFPRMKRTPIPVSCPVLPEALNDTAIHSFAPFL